MCFEKLIQIVNYILKKNNGVMNYTKLIKLLYIADKKSIGASGYPITGDSYSSLPKGPILSKLLDLIKSNCFSIASCEISEWNTFFVKDEYNLKLSFDNKITTGKLSKREILILDEVDKEYKDKSWRDMIEVVHDKEQFPEVKWEEAERGRTNYPLPLKDIYTSVGISADEFRAIQKEKFSLKRERSILYA